MENSRITLIFAACLLSGLGVTGCGRPAETRSTPQAAHTQEDVAPSHPVPVSTNAPTIVTFGDSLTAGVAGRSYPEQLQDLLLDAGYHYRIDNQGVSGDTTTDGLARIGNVVAVHPALVVLEFGGNDGLRGIPVTATRKNLDEMLTRIQSAKLPLVLLGITLPPNYGPEYVKPFTNMFPALARQHKIPVLPFLLIHVYQNGDLMQPDGIHPNGDGNKIVAQDVFELIKPLLKKQ